MGCDIHLHVESRDASGAWTKHDHPKWMRQRSYGIFGALAGVRSKVPLIAPVRGIPKDFVWPPENKNADYPDEKPYTEEEFFGDDGHSASCVWLYELEEYAIRELEEEHAWIQTWAADVANFMRGLSTEPRVRPNDNVRIVFWFDN